MLKTALRDQDGDQPRAAVRPGLFLALALAVLIGEGCTTRPPPNYQNHVQELPIGEYELAPSLSYLTLNTPKARRHNTLLSFDQFAASLDFNEKYPEQTRLEAIIHLQSVSAIDESLSPLLADAELFNSRHFPVGRFTSTDIDIISEDTMQISGDLDLRGISHPIVLTSRFIGAALNPITGERTLAFNASATVSAKEFGLPASIGTSELELQLYGEFLRNSRVRIY
jgi:polyisoprenoid-binding protein YceI